VRSMGRAGRAAGSMIRQMEGTEEKQAGGRSDREDLLQQKIRTLPTGPGVYQFKDEKGSVIYVGKARNLRQRVRQYFAKASSDSRFFIHYLRKNAVDVEAIAAGSDAEALILENNLIKELRPKFNIRLRDDKDYLCIRIDPGSPWPRFELVRRPTKDGARYFGPYSSGANAKDLYKFINRNFMLRTCSEAVFRSRKRPCLQHQIGRCMGPCTLPVDGDLYAASVGNAVMLLEGKTRELKEKLRGEMLAKSRAMEYESAGRTRDLMQAVDMLDGGQRVVDIERADTDVVGLAREMDRIVITLMFVRGGKVIGVRSEKFSRIGSGDEESLASFILQYYGEDHYLPAEILVSRRFPGSGLVEGFIRRQRGAAVRLLFPRRGKGRGLVRMADENAARALSEWESMEDAAASRLEYVASRLRLPKVPERIECIDISHTSGKEVVGSVVVMQSGELRRSEYKRFKVRSKARGDDFMAMQEVLTRRLARGVRGEKKWTLPDLLLVDGGKGHLKLASLLKEELRLGDMAVAAMAKDRRREHKSFVRLRVKERILEEDREMGLAPAGDGETPVTGKQPKGFDTIYTEGRKEGVPASMSTPLGMLVRLRDEAHRFAVGYHRKLRGRPMASSELLQVRGVGRATVARLYENFRGIDEMAAAGAEEIARKAGISLKLAAAIKEQAQKLKKTGPRD
jgi:excinuclease ABC subunit C